MSTLFPLYDPSFGDTPPHPEGHDRAPQACRQCSRLKRKCPRELPYCSLCVRLGKDCEYPSGRKPYGSPYTSDTQSTSPNASGFSSGIRTRSPFPDAFFIDSEAFESMNPSALKAISPIPEHISQLLGSDANDICELYFSSVDIWFPFISRKRLSQGILAGLPAEKAGLALLLLCMKVITDIPQLNNVAPADSILYIEAKRYLNTLEESSPTSMHIFQSLVLIALYEVGHAVFPAAYLTIGRAARLGILRGVHDRKSATQLFKGPQTWTSWEEERRSWWATSILERYINFGPVGLPLATPEPSQGDLLPTADSVWFSGEVGPSQPLYTSGVLPSLEIGPFARACQAAHILGRVITHRNYRKEDRSRDFILDEALQLTTTLTALDQHLSEAVNGFPTEDAATTLDIALCTCARLGLYHQYSCNLPDALETRFMEETQIQASCIAGIKQIVSVRASMLARCILSQGTRDPRSLNPLVIQALYEAATECQWMLQDGSLLDEAANTLQEIMDALTLLSQRWVAADRCLDLLRKSSDQ